MREPAFLVLTALAGRPQHGYTLIEDVDRLSEGRVRLRTGTVYSILDRLREAGLIEIEREEVVASRLRRYYRLTGAGAAHLGAEAEALRRRANAADTSLRHPPRQASGPDRISDDFAGDGFLHLALFYRDTEEYLAGTVPFIERGLETGDAVAVVVPTANLSLIRDALGARAAQVQLQEMTTVGRNPGRIIPTVLLSFAHNHPEQPVRVVGEPVYPSRGMSEYPACAQHEALINRAFDGLRATILCPYDAGQLDEKALYDAARTHPLVIDDRGKRPSADYAPEAVIEAYNQPLPDSDLNPVDVLHVTPDNAGQAAQFAVTQAARRGVATSRRRDVEYAVTELVSNSMRHGGGRARLAVGLASGYFVCQVQDAGTLTDPLAGRRWADPGPQSERGLLIVNRSADLVRTHARAGSTTVRVYFGLNQN